MTTNPSLLVFGGTGFLGRHICAWASTKRWLVSATHLSQPVNDDRFRWMHCDILDDVAVLRTVEDVQPSVVVNAAYRQHGAGALETCSIGARNVAAAASAVGARTIHVSTDLVFDGSLGRPYREIDHVSPLSDYGKSKAEGESLVLSTDPTAAVARTSLIYGGSMAPQEQLVSRAVRNGDIAFFIDEWRSPADVRLLAAAIGTLALSDHTGIIHLAGDERLNRLDFARLLATHLGLDPGLLIGRTQDPALGPRPKDVSLDCNLSRSLGMSITGPTALLSGGIG